MHPGVQPMMLQLEVLLYHMDKQQPRTMDLMDLQHLLLVLEVHTRHPLEVEILLGDRALYTGLLCISFNIFTEKVMVAIHES